MKREVEENGKWNLGLRSCWKEEERNLYERVYSQLLGKEPTPEVSAWTHLAVNSLLVILLFNKSILAFAKNKGLGKQAEPIFWTISISVIVNSWPVDTKFERIGKVHDYYNPQDLEVAYET